MTLSNAPIDQDPFSKAAYSYLEHGPVIPMEFQDKRPCNGVKWKGGAAPTTIEEVQRYCGGRRNIALRLDNYLVIDVDGQEGIRSLSKLKFEVGDIPTDVVQESGGGGLHIFFRISHDDARRIRTKHPRYPKIDFKAGDGHLLVMAPSIHPNGKPYKWMHDSKPLDQAPEAPKALIEALSSASIGTFPDNNGQGQGRTGERHYMALHHGLKLFNQGRDLASIRESLWSFVDGFLDPWPPEEAANEINGIVQWLEKLERGTLFPKTATAYDIAEFLAPSLRGNLYKLDNNDWFVRSGGIFKFSRRDDIRPMLIRAIKPALKNFELWLAQVTDDETRKNAEGKLRHLKALNWTDKAIDAIAAREEFKLSTRDLDPPDILNFLNGPFHLNGSPAPEAVCTKQMGVAFKPDAASCKRFDEFLAWAMSEGKRETFMEAVAHSMRGVRNSQNLWLIEGPAAAGKSVLMGVLQAIFGDYAVAPDTALLFDKRSQSGGSNEDLYSLRGARLAVFSEGPEGAPLAASRVKSLTSGDMLSARQIYAHTTQFENVAELFLMTNHETNLNVDDGGIRRRIKRILFKNTVPEEDRDPNLKSLILEEGAAIVNQLLALIPKIEERGMVISSEIQADTATLLERQDIMGAFVRECVDVNPNETVKGSDLYLNYKMWCFVQGFAHKTAVQFYRNFEAKAPSAAAYLRGNVKWYRGVSIRGAG